jgi:uncharacterized damage-inducible protein DinB
LNLVDLVRFQLAHSTWAISRLLDAAATLPASAIEENLGIGPGSLRENLAHTIECMFFFADNFAGREYAERPHFAERTKALSGLLPLLNEADSELRTAMLAAIGQGLSERILWPNADARSLPSAAAISQVFDHAALHRTQCINMLKRLGVQPVPDLDPMSFQASGSSW